MLDDLAIRHFAALHAVAAERSFGRAAERLGFTQSAVSQQIATFEKAIGQPLFDRPGGPRPIELTPTGEIMLRHAEAILGHLDSAADEVAQLLAGVGGRLSIGTFQSITVKVLPDVLGRIKVERPELTVRLTESSSNEELVDLLLSGTIDLAFLADSNVDERLALTPLGSDRFVVIAPADDGSPTIRPEELATRPLIGQLADDSCQYTINQYLWAADISPHYAFRTNDNAAVQAMVRVGVGIAVMGYLAVDPDDPGILIRELSPPMPKRTHFAAQRAGRTAIPAADRFVALVKQRFVELGMAESTPADY